MCETDKRHVTLLADYSGMAERIRHATLDLYRTETVIPLAIAVFYTWLYGRQDTMALPRWIACIPVALTLLGGARQWMRYRYLNSAHGYLKLLESNLYPGENNLGWHGYWEGNDKSRHGLMRTIFWVLLLGATAGLAVTEIPASGVTQEPCRRPPG